MYTWGFSILDDDHDNKKNGSCCSGDMLKSISGKGSSQKHRQQSRTDSKVAMFLSSPLGGGVCIIMIVLL